MRLNPRLAGFLTQALQHEMTAVQQYATQACLCDLWGLPDMAAYFRHESAEELEHAERILRRMLTVGMLPNATQLAAVRPGRDPYEMLQLDRQLELEAIWLYQEGLECATRYRDPATQALFAGLLSAEQHHFQELEQRLASSFQQEDQNAGCT
jgi:bacterioferritin